jgi:hypothetical protein
MGRDWFVGIVSGVVSATLVSYVFYLLSGKQLRTEADQLRQEAVQQRQLSLLMLHAMEAAKLVEFNRDQFGNPIGIIFNFKTDFGDKMELSGSAQTELCAAKPPEEKQ